MPFAYANPTSGPSAGGIGWYDFGAGFTLTPGQTLLNQSATLNNGDTVTFDLSLATISGQPATFNSITVPNGPAYFGNVTGGYTGLENNYVGLLSTYPGGASEMSINLTNIVVRDPQGNILPNYTGVVVDAQTTTGVTDPPETQSYITNGGNWVQLAQLGNTNVPTLTGLGTQTATLTGNSPPQNAVFVLTTSSPTAMSLRVSWPDVGSTQGVAFGFATTHVRLQKNVAGRIDPTDQFTLSVAGNPTSTVTTAGTASGIQTQVADVSAIPGTAYTINEAIAPGSASTLADYTQTVSAANATPAGSVPPTGALPISFTPQLGDNVTYTVLNTAPESFTKAVDKAYADIGDTLTYTLTVTNPNNFAVNNVLVTDDLPQGTAYADTLTVSVPYTGTDPQSGITLTTLDANATATITYQVTVNTTPPISVPVTNVATFSVPGGTSGNSNAVQTQINTAFVAINKMASATNAGAGDIITYTLMLMNAGNVAADNVVITDAVPNGTAFVPGSVTGATGTPPTLTLNAPIAPGATSTVTYQVRLGDTVPAPNPIPNTATAAFNYTVDPAEPNGANGNATSNTVNTQVNIAALTSNKTASAAFAQPGDIITYTITLNNTGNADANNVVLTDAIPTGTTFVANSVTGATGTPPTLTLNAPVTAGGTSTVTFQVQVDDAIPNPSLLSNTATANFTYTSDPENPNGATGTTQTNAAETQVNQAQVNIVKAASPAAVDVNGIITYTLTLTNPGNVAANNVVITDAVPAGTAFVPDSVTGATGTPPTLTLNAPIAPNGTATVTYQVQVGGTIPATNPVPNSATAAFTFTADPANPNGASGTGASNTVNTPVNNAALTTTKTVDKANANIGDVLTYTITLNNTGNTAANNVVLTDNIPAGTTFVPGSVTGATGTPPTLTLNAPVAAGGNATVTFQVRVDNAIPATNPLSNTVSTAFTYTVDPANPNGASGTSEAETPADTQVNAAVITSTKTADTAFAGPGDIITYTVALQNTGNADANNVVLTDNIPAGTTFVPGSVTGATGTPPTLTLNAPVTAGGSATVTFQVQVGDTVPASNPLNNTATAAFTYTSDPENPNGSTGTAASTTATTQVNIAALTTTKTGDKAYAMPGDIITYTIALQNTGNTAANNVVLTDAIPAGTSFVAGSVTGATGAPPTLTLLNPVGAGGSATVTFQVKVDSTIPTPNPILNSASAAFTYTIDPANPNGATGTSDSNTFSTQVNAAIVTTTKESDTTFADVGDTVTYTITVQNTGNVAANQVVITDAIPAGTTFVPGSLTGATGTPPTLTLNNPVPAGDSVTISYQVKVGSALPNPNPLQNTASAAFAFTVDPAQPNAATGTAPGNTVATQVNTARLNVVKNADKAVSYIGDTVTYQIAVTNTGNVDANDVVISDPIPTGTTLVPGSLTVSVPYTGAPDAGITLTGPIAPEQTVAIAFKVTVNTIPNPNPINNTATVSYAYNVDPTSPVAVTATAASNTKSTVVFRYNFSQQINDMLESVALEEAALAAIANAEGAKIQAMVAMPGITTQELLCLNKSVSDMMDSIAMLEAVLKQKLGVVGCQLNGSCM